MVIKLNGNEVYRNRVEVQQFNNLTDKVEFIFDKTVNDIDLSECVARIVVGDLDFMILGVHDNLTGKVEGDNYVLTWMIGGADTLRDMMYDCQVSFTKAGKMLFKEMFTLSVLQSMPTDHPEYTINTFEEYLDKYNETLDETKATRDEVTEMAGQVTIDKAEVAENTEKVRQYEADTKANTERAAEILEDIKELKEIIDEDIEDGMDAVDTAVNTGVNLIDEASDSATSGINAAKTEAIDSIGFAKNGAIKNIETAENLAMDQVANLANYAMSEINTDKTDALGAISSAKSGAVKEIADTKDGVVAAANTAKTEAIDAVNQKKEQSITEIDAKRTSSINDIENAKTNAITEFNSDANVQRITDLETDSIATKDNLTNLDGRVTTLENEPKVPAELVKQVVDHERRITNLEYAGDGFLYRKEEDSAEAYSKTIPSGAMPWAKFDELGGKSVVWNQIVTGDKGSYSASGITVTKNQDGSISMNGTATGVFTFPVYVDENALKPNHVCISTFKNIEQRLAVNSGTISNTSRDGILKTTADIGDLINPHILLTVRSGETVNINNVFPCLRDLTTIFGVTETSQVTNDMIAWVEVYASEHPEYCENKIISADVESVDVQGANLFDGEIEGGTIDGSGNNSVSASSSRSVNYIPVNGNTDYYYQKNVNTGGFYIFEYDAQKKLITNNYDGNGYGGVFRTKSDGRYLRIVFHSVTIDSDNNEVMISKGNSKKTFMRYNADMFKSILIPEAIRDLPGFGWSAGTAYNRIFRDGDKWWYEQNVVEKKFDSDLSYYTNNWQSGYGFYVGVLDETCDRQQFIASNGETAAPDSSKVGIRVGAGNKNIYWYGFCDKYGVEPNSESIKNYFKQHDVFIRYERTIPILTDITDLIPDGFENLCVEEGGSLTFVNDSYLPVPNKESYLIKLGGVTA